MGEMCFLQFYAANDSMHLNRNLQYLISIYWYVQKSWYYTDIFIVCI